MARAIALDDEVDRREVWRWALAALLMLAAHLGIVATYLLLHRPDAGPSGAPVVVIDMAPYPAAPQQDQVELPPGPPMQEAQPDPEQKVETPPDVLPLPPIPTPEVVTTVLPPPPEQPPEKKVEDKPPPPKPVQAKKKPAPRTAPAASAPARADAPASSQLGVSAEASRAQASWRDLLVAHLQRHKRYPAGAQSRGDQGTVLLSFSMDRNGHVLSRSLARSSGVPELDQEVLAMIQRAQPLPPFPPAMPQPRMTLTVPIRFTPR